MDNDSYTQIVLRKQKEKAERESSEMEKKLNEKQQLALLVKQAKQQLSEHCLPEFEKACSSLEKLGLRTDCLFTEKGRDPLECTLLLEIGDNTLRAVSASTRTVHFTVSNTTKASFNTLPVWKHDEHLHNSLTQHTVKMINRFIEEQVEI